jgi:hypothetical protein
VIACGVPLKKPSAVRQAVWAYWEICRLGSSAEDEIVKRARKIMKQNNGRRQRGFGAVERWSARGNNL